tara:strand:+ start:340 stop:453 length:114 start_codon:yes stop_codon:yes gene_type:complete
MLGRVTKLKMPEKGLASLNPTKENLEESMQRVYNPQK